MEVTTAIEDLRTLFNQVDEIYYKSTEVTASSFADLDVDMEFPVLSDGVTFDTGSADVTRIRLTTGTLWTSRVSKGDPDISFQVATVDANVNQLFMEKVGDISAATTLVTGSDYAGASYKTDPKKVTGALIMFSEDKQTVIVLPNVEMYASLVVADGDNPAYYNLSVSNMPNSEGADIMILKKKAA